MADTTMYNAKKISRKAAIFGVTQGIFYKRARLGLPPSMSYPALKMELQVFGLGEITHAEISDVWRYSEGMFHSDADEQMAG